MSDGDTFVYAAIHRNQYQRAGHTETIQFLMQLN